jgi:hypothetical protein
MAKNYFTLLLILLAIITISPASAQDSIKTEKVKTGWNFGGIPVVSYNSDLGLQYGILTNIYQYGDGKIYPGYYHSLYAEVSRFTKGSGIYRFFYDSKYLLPKVRTIFDICYLPDQALDFYGFNGKQAVYNKEWEDDKDSLNYKSRMYYNHKRNIFRIKLDFQGKTPVNNLRWAAGLEFMNVDVATVDIERLNKGKSADKILPDTNTLYDDYVEWGIIKPKEAKGGFFTSAKAGLVYDSRDNEPNPMKGIWTEVVFYQSFSKDYTYTKLAFTHRQYFTLVKNRLSFAYRLGYQGIIAGEAPFYQLPYMVYSYLPASTSDGLGGSKTVRGIIRNRVVGEGMVFGNLELRWQFVKFHWINQNFYLALSPFLDMGQVVAERKIDKSGIPATVDQSQYFNLGKDQMHFSYGGGFHLAMNQNFVIACDLGFPVDKQDGKKGLYIALNWLF